MGYYEIRQEALAGVSFDMLTDLIVATNRLATVERALNVFDDRPFGHLSVVRLANLDRNFFPPGDGRRSPTPFAVAVTRTPIPNVLQYFPFSFTFSQEFSLPLFL